MFAAFMRCLKRISDGVRRISVGGRQYIAVSAGGGFNGSSLTIYPGIDQISGSNMVYVFALPE
jgi:hypothetical protein